MVADQRVAGLARAAGAPPRSRRSRRAASRRRAGRAAPASVRAAAAAWKRSSTWWTRIPKRWLSVGSVGIRKTRANLYFSGHDPVGLDVGGGQHEALAAARQERLQRRLLARRDGRGAAALVALGVEQVVVERDWSRRSRAARRSPPATQPRVDLRQRVGDRLSRRALDQRRELDQLEVAHDRVRRRRGRCRSAARRAGRRPRDGLQQLVAQHPERRVQRLGRPEQLLLALLPLPPPSAARASSANGDGGCSAPRSRARRRRRARAACARASSRRAAGAASRRRARRASPAAAAPSAARRGSARARAGARPACAPTAGRARRRARTRGPWRVHRHHRARRAALAVAGRLLLAQPGVGDRGDGARELARAWPAARART